MDRKLRMPPFLLDLRVMGWTFYVPILVMLCGAFYLWQLFSPNVSSQILPNIRAVMGVTALPLVSFWIIGLYQDVVEAEGKELLLSLPYGLLQYGLLRVLRALVCYGAVFAVVLYALYAWSGAQTSAFDWYLPAATMFYFAALSFVIVLATKNTLISYSVIGVYCAFDLMTRGVFTGWLYPFYWSAPKHYTTPWEVLISLTAAGIVLLIAGQWLFTRKEYLVR